MIGPMALGRRQAPARFSGRINRLPVNFLARLVDDHHVTIDVARGILAANPARHLLAMRDRGGSAREFKSDPITDRDTVLRVEVVGSHQYLQDSDQNTPPKEAASLRLPAASVGLAVRSWGICATRAKRITGVSDLISINPVCDFLSHLATQSAPMQAEAVRPNRLPVALPIIVTRALLRGL